MRAPSHRHLRRAVSAYADGELDDRAAQMVATHLLECDGCSHNLEMVLAIKDSLRRRANAEPPTLAGTRLRRWAATLAAPSPELQSRIRLIERAASDAPGSILVRTGQADGNRIRARVGALAVGVAVVAAMGGLLLHRQGPSPDAPATEEPEAVVLRGTFDAAVENAFVALPDKFRRVVELVDLGGLSYQEAAVTLDAPVGTVMSRVHRGRSRIRVALQATGLQRGKEDR